MTMIEEPLLTRVVPWTDLQLEKGSVYLFGNGIEDRAILESSWRTSAEANGVRFIEVVESSNRLTLVEDSQLVATFTGRQRREVVNFLSTSAHYYIDITGMLYTAWAPLVRSAIEAKAITRVIYVEPADYRRSTSPTHGMLFDLSDGFDGIQPIPGFAALRARTSSDWHLVAALGFEGSRFSYVVNALEPAIDQIYPIIGVPGFRPEFASNALIANRTTLENLDILANVRFARANCPFDFFQTLRKIHIHLEGAQLRVAAIGTKPHGLGAVLYTISSPTNVQLIYDHPRRKAKRTEGVSRVCVYDVSTFCESDLFRQSAQP